MMTKTVPINYQKFWALLYIIIGLNCMLIFIIGAIYLNDKIIFLYVLPAILPIYLGFKMFYNYYAEISETEVVVYNIFGGIKHKYLLKSDEDFVIIKNRIFIHKDGKYKKIKINNWLINSSDWKKMLCLLNKDKENEITQHLLSEND